MISYSIDSTIEKIEYYNLIGLHDLLIIAPRNFMQSISLTYARCEYLKSIGININMNNYQELFLADKVFKNRYNVSKKELLSKYNYIEYRDVIK